MQPDILVHFFFSLKFQLFIQSFEIKEIGHLEFSLNMLLSESFLINVECLPR